MMTKDELILKLGIQNVDPETQKTLLENFANAVSTRLMVQISEVLTDDDLDRLDILIDEDDEDKTTQFIRSKFENYDDFATKIENEMIEEMSQKQQMLSSRTHDLGKTTV